MPVDGSSLAGSSTVGAAGSSPHHGVGSAGHEGGEGYD